jgi:hypothetical protein
MSPRVRARISTPPPAEYGTKICTALDGNGDCAAALPPAPNIAAAATIRNNRPNNEPPKNKLPKNHLLKVPSRYSRCFFYDTPLRPSTSLQRADHGNDRDMLTIPPIASSFGGSTGRSR